MKIQWSRALQDELFRFFDMREIAGTMEMVTRHFLKGCILPVSIETVIDAARSENKELYQSGDCFSEIKQNIVDFTGKQFTEADVEKRLAACTLIEDISRTSILDNACCRSHLMANLGFFTQEQLEQNPYYQDVIIPDVQVGNVHISTAENPKNAIVLYNNATVLEYGIKVPSLGLMETPIRYPVFEKGEEVWMSVDPQEITTMQDGIDKSHGKVLTLGCGMGYFAYMASLKETVESVTIVELDSEVIEMFKTYILPQLKTKDKIQIIQADAICFMEQLEDGQYDYCYADIWRGPMDLKVYLNLRAACNRFKKMETQYWLEPNMNVFLLENLIYWVRNRLMKSIPMEIRTVLGMFFVPDKEGLFPLWDEIFRKYTLRTPKELQDFCTTKTITRILNDKKLGKSLAVAKLKF